MGVFGVAVSFDVEMWPVVVNTDQFSVGHSTMGATDEIIGRGGLDDSPWHRMVNNDAKL